MNDSALWPQYSRNEPRYFILNSEVRGVGHGPRATACAFWNEFMPKLSNRQSKFCLSFSKLPLKELALTPPQAAINANGSHRQTADRSSMTRSHSFLWPCSSDCSDSTSSSVHFSTERSSRLSRHLQALASLHQQAIHTSINTGIYL